MPGWSKKIVFFCNDTNCIVFILRSGGILLGHNNLLSANYGLKNIKRGARKGVGVKQRNRASWTTYVSIRKLFYGYYLCMDKYSL